MRALGADHSAVGADAAFSALIGGASARLSALLTMTPTTLAGCAAMLRYVEHIPSGRMTPPASCSAIGLSRCRAGRFLAGRLAAVIEPAASAPPRRTGAALPALQRRWVRFQGRALSDSGKLQRAAAVPLAYPWHFWRFRPVA